MRKKATRKVAPSGGREEQRREERGERREETAVVVSKASNAFPERTATPKMLQEEGGNEAASTTKAVATSIKDERGPGGAPGPAHASSGSTERARTGEAFLSHAMMSVDAKTPGTAPFLHD